MFSSRSIIAHNDPKSPISEAYRVLRTNILFSSFDKPIKSLVVTSAGPGEGKSTTIINLAVTFAQQGSKVLLIDADFRKPKIHRYFGFDNVRGLSNYLSERSEDDYSGFLKSCDIPNLSILICGAIPPNPSELLMSNAMKRFIERAKEDFDIVLVDAPPAIAVTDAAIISTIVDGTILVVAAGIAEAEAAVRAKEILKKVNANIIGVVLNKISKSTNYGYHNYYYQYYYGENEEAGAVKRKRKALFRRRKKPEVKKPE